MGSGLVHLMHYCFYLVICFLKVQSRIWLIVDVIDSSLVNLINLYLLYTLNSRKIKSRKQAGVCVCDEIKIEKEIGIHRDIDGDGEREKERERAGFESKKLLEKFWLGISCNILFMKWLS